MSRHARCEPGFSFLSVLKQEARNLTFRLEKPLEFLRTGNYDGLPARVSLPAPKFVVPSFPLSPSNKQQ